MSGLSKSAIALASLLATAGCAGNKAKPNDIQPAVQSAPKIKVLPLSVRTAAEHKHFEDITKNYCIVYTDSNGAHKIEFSSTTTAEGNLRIAENYSDLTQLVSESYPGQLNPPKVFASKPSEYFFTDVDNKNIYKYSASKDQKEIGLDLIASNIDLGCYDFVGDTIIFITKDGKSIKKLNSDGSHETELFAGETVTFNDLVISPSQKRVIFTKSPVSRGGSLSIFNNAAYYVMDLEGDNNSKPMKLGFEGLFGEYDQSSGPQNVSFLMKTDNGRSSLENKILFTYRYPTAKGNNLYSVELGEFLRDCGCIPLKKETLKRITSDDAPITYAKQVKDNSDYIIYVQDGKLFLAKDNDRFLLLEQRFNGSEPLLVKK